MSRKCGNDNREEVCQKWPTHGKLSKNISKTLCELKKF